MKKRFGIRLRVWGSRACFTRPELKSERMTYSVPTPSAMRAIVEAIYRKQSIRWVITEIQVLKKPQYENFKVNEVQSKLKFSNIAKDIKNNNKDRTGNFFIQNPKERQQRTTTILRDVEYIVSAYFEYIGYPEDKKTEANDVNPGKHLEMINNRLKKGKCFKTPYFGCREYPVFFEYVDPDTEFVSELKGETDLGFMIYDLDYSTKPYTPMLYNPIMKDGIITVPHYASDEVKK